MYVLILIISLQSHPGSNAITAAEYTSQARCEAAGEKFKEKHKEFGPGTAEYICTQK
jgi:hypothetical protein